jgi:5-methyltetrahydropteroyltriglutamate--homocysteine methyltransferase
VRRARDESVELERLGRAALHSVLRRQAGAQLDIVNFVKPPKAVADRLERAAAAIGDPRRVIGGTDCGFDTSAGMGRVAEDVVWAQAQISRRRRPHRLGATRNGMTCTR